MVSAETEQADGSTTGKTKGRRGRKQDDSLPPSRSRDMQRAFRARKAQHVNDLENRVARLEAENKELRERLGMPPRLPTPPHSTSPPSTSHNGDSYGHYGSGAGGDDQVDTPSDVGETYRALKGDSVEVSSACSPAPSANISSWSQPSTSVRSPVRSPLPPTPGLEQVRVSLPPISPVPNVNMPLQPLHRYPQAAPSGQPLELLAHAASPGGTTIKHAQQPSLPSFLQAQHSNGYVPQKQTNAPSYAAYQQNQDSLLSATSQANVLPPISAPSHHAPNSVYRLIQAPPQARQMPSIIAQHPQHWPAQYPQMPQMQYAGDNNHTGLPLNIQSTDPAAHAYASSASAMMCRPTEDCCPAPPPRANGSSAVDFLQGSEQREQQHTASITLINTAGPSPPSSAVPSAVDDAAAAAATLTTLTTLESLIPYEPRLLPDRPPAPTPEIENLFISLYAPDAATAVVAVESSHLALRSTYRLFVLALMRGVELTQKGPCARVSYSAEEEMQLCTPAGATCCGGLLDCAAASELSAQADEIQLRARRGSVDGGDRVVLGRKEGWLAPSEVWEMLTRHIEGRESAYDSLVRPLSSNRSRRTAQDAHLPASQEATGDFNVDAELLAELVLEHGRPQGERPGLVSRNVRCETACGLIIAQETVRDLVREADERRRAALGGDDGTRIIKSEGASGEAGPALRRPRAEEDELRRSDQLPIRKKVCCGPNRTC